MNILFFHLLAGNLMFFWILFNRETFIPYYNRCSYILEIHGKLRRKEEIKTKKMPKIKENEVSPVEKSSFLGYLLFYAHFTIFTWMIFVTTFLAAEISLKINPKIKEYM